MGTHRMDTQPGVSSFEALTCPIIADNASKCSGYAPQNVSDTQIASRHPDWHGDRLQT